MEFEGPRKTRSFKENAAPSKFNMGKASSTATEIHEETDPRKLREARVLRKHILNR